MGASPTPMAFGEVYTSLQTGVIDGYEHDASTTLQQRFYEVARFMARTRHIAGVLGLFASTVGTRPRSARPPPDARGRGARGRAAPARDGCPTRTRRRPRSSPAKGMTIRDIDRPRLPARGRAPWDERGARARRHLLARGRSAGERAGGRQPARPRPTARSGGRSRSSWPRRRPSSACRSSAATSCTARCPGPRRSRACCWRGSCASAASGALRHAQHPRVTALVRLLPSRGGRPSIAASGSCCSRSSSASSCRPGASPWRARPSGCRRAASPARRSPLVLPVALAADVRSCSSQQLPRRLGRARGARRSRGRSAPAGLVVASVLVPLVAGAAPLRRARDRLPRDRGPRPAARLHPGPHLAHLSPRHRRGQPHHPAHQDPRRGRLVRAARDPALRPGRRAHGIRRHLGAHRGPGDGDRGPGARRPGHGGGRGRGPLLRHLGLDGRRRVGDQLAARPVDAAGRLLGTRVGQRGRRGFRHGHPRAAVPDHGRARLARQPVDRDALPRRVRPRVPAGGDAPRS